MDDDQRRNLSEHLRGKVGNVGQGQLLQQRIENVHLVVAIGILGWYVTGHQDQLVNIGLGTDGFFFGTAVIAGIFVGGKVNTITLRMTSFGGKYVRFIDEFVLPFFFFVALDGLIATFLVYAIYTESGVSVSQSVVAGIVVVVTGVISYRMAVAWNRYTDELRDQDIAFEQRIAEIQSSDLEQLLFDNPEYIEEGFQSMILQWRDRIGGYIIAADLLGLDASSNKTVVEVKKQVTVRAVEQFRSSVVDRVEDFRFVIVGFTITDEAKRAIENSQIEYVPLNRDEISEALGDEDMEFVG